MPFFWKKSEGAIRLGDDNLVADEKQVIEPTHAPRPNDTEATIVHNLVELGLISPDVEEEFLLEKENKAGISLDEGKERTAGDKARVVSWLFVQKSPVSFWSSVLHLLCLLFAVTGRWFLKHERALLEAHRFEGEEKYARPGGPSRTANCVNYEDFWETGVADVLSLLAVPIVWFAAQSLVDRISKRRVAPTISTIYEITMIVLLIYFPTIPVSMGGYNWGDVLNIFGIQTPKSGKSGLERHTTIIGMEARRLELSGILCAYSIAAIYFILVTTRILTAIAALARGTASKGTFVHWLHRRGHTAVSGLYFIIALLATVGASMNIWNGMWFSWHQQMERITQTWKSAGFPLQTVFLSTQVVAFLALCICVIAGDPPSAKACRRYSGAAAIVLAYSVFTCSLGIVAMDDLEHDRWPAQTTKPRHIVAVGVTAAISMIHAAIAVFPALTNFAVVEEYEEDEEEL